MPHSAFLDNETHRLDRAGWLRAAVLGANDGIVSTSSLIVGVAASSADRAAVLVAGLAGLSAGALAMAAGEYVSVSSQADIERADIAKETRELAEDPHHELAELTAIYRRRGLTKELATEVARQLTEHDALGAHLRDELGILDHNTARPIQAAAVSAASFVSGSVLPIVAAAVAPDSARTLVIVLVSMVLLAVSGAIGGRVGGASVRRAALRVLAGGSLAMAVTAVIGKIVGTAV